MSGKGMLSASLLVFLICGGLFGMASSASRNLPLCVDYIDINPGIVPQCGKPIQVKVKFSREMDPNSGPVCIIDQPGKKIKINDGIWTDDNYGYTFEPVKLGGEPG